MAGAHRRTHRAVGSTTNVLWSNKSCSVRNSTSRFSRARVPFARLVMGSENSANTSMLCSEIVSARLGGWKNVFCKGQPPPKAANVSDNCMSTKRVYVLVAGEGGGSAEVKCV